MFDPIKHPPFYKEHNGKLVFYRGHTVVFEISKDDAPGLLLELARLLRDEPDL